MISSATTACQSLLANMDTDIPKRIRELEKEAEAITRQVDVQSKTEVYSEEDKDEQAQFINDLRRQRAQRRAEIGKLSDLQTQKKAIPDEAAILEAFRHFAEVLGKASESEDELHRSQARELFMKVLGGKIKVFQAGPRKKYKGWCRLEFRLNPLVFWDGLQAACNEPGETISIEMPRPAPLCQKMADQVKVHFDKGLNLKQIGEKLGYGETFVSRSLKYWFTSRGLEKPSFHPKRSATPRLAERIADEVMELVGQDVPLTEIAKRLNTNRNRITEAIKIWHKRRGLPVPDGRALRKARNQRRREVKKKQPPETQESTPGVSVDSSQKKAITGKTSVDPIVAEGRKAG